MSPETGIRSVHVPTSRLRTHLLLSGAGSATPVLLIHGNVSSARFFTGLIPALAADRRVLAPDLRGFGASQTAEVDGTRGLADFADDLHALLAADGGSRVTGPVHLIGWSMGGGVAMRYAIDHPDRVASVTLLASMSPYGFGGTKGPDGASCWPDLAGSGGGAANPEFVRRLADGDQSADSPLSPRSVLRSTYLAPPHRLPASEEDAAVAEMLAMAIGDGNYPGTSTSSPNWPYCAPGERGVLNAISPRYCDLAAFAGIAPRPDVLWIHGDRDQIVSDASLSDFGYLGQQGLVPGWPGAEAYPPQPMVTQLRHVLDRYAAAGGSYREEVVADCGHSPHLEHPAAVAALIGEFIRSR
ncbi:MAG: alpha/beta fold hydrolase [Streptosporangiaceae bacterium]